MQFASTYRLDSITSLNYSLNKQKEYLKNHKRNLKEAQKQISKFWTEGTERHRYYLVDINDYTRDIEKCLKEIQVIEAFILLKSNYHLETY